MRFEEVVENGYLFFLSAESLSAMLRWHEVSTETR